MLVISVLSEGITVLRMNSNCALLLHSLIIITTLDILGLQWKLNSKDLHHQIIVACNALYIGTPLLCSSYGPKGPVQVRIKYMVKYVHLVYCMCVRCTL